MGCDITKYADRISLIGRTPKEGRKDLAAVFLNKARDCLSFGDSKDPANCAYGLLEDAMYCLGIKINRYGE